MTVVDRRNEPVVIPFDIEDDPLGRENADGMQLRLQLGGTLPFCGIHNLVPRIELRLSRRLLSASNPVLYEPDQGSACNHSHTGIVPCSRIGSKSIRAGLSARRGV